MQLQFGRGLGWIMSFRSWRADLGTMRSSTSTQCLRCMHDISSNGRAASCHDERQDQPEMALHLTGVLRLN